MSDRLDAFLAHAGVGSRSDVKRLIRGGRVTLDGVECRDAGEAVRGRAVAVDGEPVAEAPRGVVLAMHKPIGVSSSHDPMEAPLVFDLVPEAYRAVPLECVGRLDRETSGLLLLTDDGALNHRLTSPKRHVIKRYRATFVGPLAADAVARFAAGMTLKDDDRPTLPATLTVDAAPAGTAPGRATVLLREGRYHQVRRMFAACGARVIDLHRDRIGGLDLPPDLAPGAMRPLSEDERARLFEG
ncbi:MAG TPA: pseudouridine synthase [Planctomycetota bacterium]|nr:pseudouridine synthase [Planctomycetota bacterium]